MIKAKGISNGRPVIVLGLAEENIKRLKDNDPILVHGKDIGIDFDISIFYGQTNADLVKALKPITDKDTKVHVGSQTRAAARQEVKPDV